MIRIKSFLLKEEIDGSCITHDDSLGIVFALSLDENNSLN